MFKSITFKRHDPKTDQFLYELVDSEFGMVRIKTAHSTNGTNAVGEQACSIAREYSKRYEDAAEHSYAKASNAEHSYAKASDAYRQGLYAYVGKNIAVAAMWYSEIYRYKIVYKSKIETICSHQDGYCPKYIPNWKEYATSRDEYIAKFLLLG